MFSLSSKWVRILDLGRLHLAATSIRDTRVQHCFHTPIAIRIFLLFSMACNTIHEEVRQVVNLIVLLHSHTIGRQILTLIGLAAIVHRDLKPVTSSSPSANPLRLRRRHHVTGS